MRSLARGLGLAVLLGVAACVGPEGEGEDPAEQTGEVSSALVDAPDTRCATAFTAADQTTIRNAIAASDLGPAERVGHALNRLGYGDRFAEVAIPADTAGTLAAAIVQSLRNGPSIAASARTAMDAALPDLAKAPGDLHLAMRQQFMALEAAQAAGDAVRQAELNLAITQQRDRIIEELAGKQIMAGALAPDIALGERLQNFWLNYFNVDGRKTALWAPAFERTLRASQCGTFQGMLEAVARSPAMLRYLDNYASTAPGTVHWSGATDINENYGRELLELHTLGTGARTAQNPSSPYTQADVIAVARILTGWSYTYPADHRSTVFQFQAKYHVPGAKTVMGRSFAAGEAGGVSLLATLAARPETQRFVCTRLAGAFFATAPAEVVSACVAAWGSGGSLPRMIVAIVGHPLTWKAAQYGNMIKNPLELVISSHRLSGDREATLTGARVKSAVRAVRAMGIPQWRIDFPIGYATNHLDWLDPGYLDQQVRYVYGQSDPLGLARGTLSGNALEVFLGDLAAPSALTEARVILPLRGVTRPLAQATLLSAFATPDRAAGTTAPERPLRTLLSYYATSWQFLLQ